MTITAIILSHYKEREGNLKRIIDDLFAGETVPNEVVVFIDNKDIVFEDERVTIVRSSKSFLPKIRFALGTYFDTDYCFFIDDDLTVRNKTLSNFVEYGTINPYAFIGLEGSILGDTPTPYANDTCINRGSKEVDVDVLIRTYFIPTKFLYAGLKIQSMYPKLPHKSLDDVYLCMGSKLLTKNQCVVIPVNDETNVTELDPAGVGQSTSGEHYQNRNTVCRFLLDRLKERND